MKPNKINTAISRPHNKRWGKSVYHFRSYYLSSFRNIIVITIIYTMKIHSCRTAGSDSVEVKQRVFKLIVA